MLAGVCSSLACSSADGIAEDVDNWRGPADNGVLICWTSLRAEGTVDQDRLFDVEFRGLDH